MRAYGHDMSCHAHNGQHGAHLAGRGNCRTLGSLCTFDPCVHPVHSDSLMACRTRLLDGSPYCLILANGIQDYKFSDSWQRYIGYLSWVCSTLSSSFWCCCLWLSVSRISTWYSSSPPYLQNLRKRSSQGMSGFNMACWWTHKYEHMI